MSWLSFANYAAITSGVEHRTALGKQTVSEKFTPTTGDPYTRFKKRVRASWRWRGIDEATAAMLVMLYDASEVVLATQPYAGSYLYTSAAPVVAASSFSLYNISPNTHNLQIKAGWKLMFEGDQTIYTVSAAADVPDEMPLKNSRVITTARCLNVAIDKTNSKIYYTYDPASFPGTVNLHYCDMDGANDASVTSWTQTTGGALAGLDVSPSNSYVFYNDDHVVTREALTGGSATSIYTASDLVQFIRADDTNDYLYVADNTAALTSGVLKRMAMDGTSVSTIYTSDEGVIFSIMPDEDSGGVYWVEKIGSDYYLWRTDGPAGAPIKIKTLDYPNWCDFNSDSGMMFMVDSNALWRANPDESSAQEIVSDLSPANEAAYAMRAWVSGNYVVQAGDYDASANAGIFVSEIFTEAITLSVTPNITTATAALGMGAPVYFFIPESADGTRANDAHGWHVSLRSSFETAWIDGPPIDQG